MAAWSSLSPAHAPRRVLVTGAAGFIGSHTVEALLDGGHDVLAIDDLSSGRRANLDAARARGCRLIDDDLLASGVLPAAVASFRPDVVLHLAGVTAGPGKEVAPHRLRRLQVDTTRLVADVARKHGAARIVFGSSAAVYGSAAGPGPLREEDAVEPVDPYGSAKRAAERILESVAEGGARTCIAVRLFAVYGPRQERSCPYGGAITRLVEGSARLDDPGLRVARDFLHVRDAARGLALAATRADLPAGSMTCNLCSGVSSSVFDLAEDLRDVFPGLGRTSSGDGDRTIPRHPPGDATLAERCLGFTAGTSFADGLRELAGALRPAWRRAA